MVTYKEKIQHDYDSIYHMNDMNLADGETVLDFFDINMIPFEEMGIITEAKNYREMCAELLIASENEDACFDVISECLSLLDDFMVEVELCQMND